MCQNLEELVDAGRLNGTNFCINCMVSIRHASYCSFFRQRNLYDPNIVDLVADALDDMISKSTRLST